MKSRLEQVRSDTAAVLDGRTERLKPLAGTTIFISGGTGFLGTWLLELISALNAEHQFDIRVAIYSRSAPDFIRRHRHLGSCKAFRFLEGDIRFLTELPRETQYIIHAAALTDRRLFASNPTAVGEVNSLGTIRLLRAACLLEDLRNLLLVSSGLVYGPQSLAVERIKEESSNGFPCDNPNAIYSESKRFSEAFAASFVSETKVPLVIARPFAFVGPYQSLALPWAVTDFIRDTLAGRPIKIMGDGSTVRSLLYASDFAYWILAALACGQARHAYNIGSPEPVDLLSLAKMITQHFTPPPDILTRVGQSDHGTTRLVPCVEKARRELGVQLTVPLADAIQRTINWHRAPEIS
ncbi:MAG: NAD-dependent epimerase/dehydratase family protein [Pedosphaera sp.]|nr:NAD-dependent epimerase/dehydratase family protein [Pedosphaera sp.]